MFLNRYPYTDFHELNLDWLIEEMNKIQKQIDDLTKQLKDLADKVEQIKVGVAELSDNYDVNTETLTLSVITPTEEE